MTRAQWALRHRATPRIFHEPIPFGYEYGCVGLRDERFFPVVHAFADDIVLCSTRSEEVEMKLRRGEGGVNISRKKKLYTRGSMYIGTWMGTHISIYMEIIWKE